MSRKPSKKLLESKPDPIKIEIRKDANEDNKYYIKLGSSSEEVFEFPNPQTILQVCKGRRPPSKFILFRIVLQGYLAQKKLERCRISKIASDLWKNDLDQNFKSKFELLSNQVKKSYKQKKLIIQMYNPSSSPLTNKDNRDDDHYNNTTESSTKNKETGDEIDISVEKKGLTNEEKIDIATELFPGFSNYTENDFDAEVYYC